MVQQIAEIKLVLDFSGIRSAELNLLQLDFFFFCSNVVFGVGHFVVLFFFFSKRSWEDIAIRCLLHGNKSVVLRCISNYYNGILQPKFEFKF